MKPSCYFFGLGLFLIIGCVAKTISPGANRAVLFPLGKYTHEIAITTNQQHTYSFKGIVKISEDKIVVVGLSAFQTTVFRISENRATGRVESEVFIDALERHKDSLLDFYSLLSRFLKLPREGKQLEGVTVDHYDSQGIPDEISMLHPKYRVHVKVVDYEI